MAERGKISPWVWVGCGCVGGVLAIVAVVVGVVFVVGLGLRGMAETMKDPAAREARVEEILGTEELPEGYNPVIGFNIPLVGEVVVLAANQPDDSGQLESFGDRGFAYVKLTGVLGRRKRQELKDFVEGRGNPPDITIQSEFRIDSDEVLKRGKMDLEGGTLAYAVHRGKLESKDAPGLANMMVLDCPDGTGGFGIWFGRDPSAEGTGGDAALAGTPADESAVREFLGHFDLCPN